MIRLLLSIALLSTPTLAFLTPSPHKPPPTALHAASKINNKIDLSSKKVVNTQQLSEGDKAVYCRCWKSETFPLCDGAHVAHNKDCGDNVGPLILSAQKSEVAETTTPASAGEAAAANESQTALSKVKKFLGFQKEKDGLTTRQRLAKMGLSALLSYGWVSNMSYAVTLSLSWYTHSKKTGLSPLAPGQWKPFLAVYAGFYVFNNLIRPLRFGASVIVSKYFDNFVDFIQRKTNWSRKWSIGCVVFLANVCGTFGAMGLGVAGASLASGVPIFPPKV